MVSIIVVNYKVKKQLFACIQSIINSAPHTPFEIIVVDNDEKKTIYIDLQKKFPQVKYIPNENKGFGQGNNRGAREAKGNYLFFLNPDTKVFSGTIDLLVAFLEKNKKTGIVAPLLHDMKGRVYQQGSLELTPSRSFFTMTFFNKVFPKNPVSKSYYLSDWDKKSIKEVDVVPGTAFLIPKETFNKVGGFDEKFFLFFEEFDLCKRIKNKGNKLFILPSSKVNHYWGASTGKSSANIKQIFEKSRFYYFKKHYGIASALLVEILLRCNKHIALLLGVLILGIFLRFYHFTSTMTFIGDQGWFYLSARDILLTGNLPLVGIASSHPWLHQGAFWTYLLAGVFSVFGFNPLNGGYLSIFIDLLAGVVLYKVGSSLFSKNVGIISTSLYLTSPLVILDAHMPYHTVPISLLTTLYIYSLYKWVGGNLKYFPILIFLLSTLYNFELVTILFCFFTAAVIIYGWVKRRVWTRNLLQTKIVFFSLLGFFVPMFPMLLHDLEHGFTQTLGMLAWIGYRVAGLIGLTFGSSEIHAPLGSIASFYIEKYTAAFISFHPYFSIFLLISSLVFGLYLIFSKNKEKNESLLVFLTIFLVIGILASKTASSAYVPMLIPCFVLLLSILGARLMKKRFTTLLVIGVFLAIIVGNVFNYITEKNKNIANQGGNFEQRMKLARYVVQESKGKEYNFVRKGIGSQFESLTMNYEYLTWWLGHGPSKKPQKLKFIIDQYRGGTRVNKIIQEQI